jgi:hypothetical protein
VDSGAEDRAETTVSLLGGLVLEDGGRIDRVGLRPVSGQEEEWLARHPTAPTACAVTQVLASCLRLDDGEPNGAVPSPRALARRLLVGDRDYLMVQLRRATLGDMVAAIYRCPRCDQPMDVAFDLADLPVEPAPQQVVWYSSTLADGGPVRFRLPNGADQESVAELPAVAAEAALLDRCLVAERAPLSQEERDRVIEEMERLACKVELELDLTCPECAHAFLTVFDVSRFFFAELAVSRRTLLREVHHLAFHYGWSEQAILALDRDRRHAYLSLLADELRQE